jgi:hypothetical protein
VQLRVRLHSTETYNRWRQTHANWQGGGAVVCGRASVLMLPTGAVAVAAAAVVTVVAEATLEWGWCKEGSCGACDIAKAASAMT